MYKKIRIIDEIKINKGKIIKDLLCKIQLLGIHYPRKFIILSRSRTGSTLLLRYMQFHKNIYARGEIFRRIGQKKEQFILEDFFNRKYPFFIKYIGFKIFYYHPLDKANTNIFNLLEDIEGLKIIHLKRENVLRTILSRKIAGKTGRYSAYKNIDKKVLDKRIYLDPIELKNEIDQTKKWETDFDNFFSSKDIVEVKYENMVSNIDRVLVKIKKFLNLKKEFSKKFVYTKKQNPEKLKDLIENYQELINLYKNTEYFKYLSDNNREVPDSAN